MLSKRTLDSYHFGFNINLTDRQLRSLIALFRRSVDSSVSLLGGRSAVSPARLDGIGSVVVKHYRRGGLMRYFVKRRYLRFGKTRGQREFDLLEMVGNIGINAPQPIAFAHHGRLLYRAWLVTREIRQPQTLARLSLKDAKCARAAMISASDQISLLIDHHLLHVDLHPGNVVIDAQEQVFLLDFDKGRVYRGNRQKLTERYLARWQRAVRKHGLPEILSETMSNELQGK
jgi:3-deoxy-D-manno-octulosonic acid kinase